MVAFFVINDPGESDMAYILSIETSTNISSVAIHADGNLIGSMLLNLKHSHAEQLIPSIEKLTETCGLQIGEFEAIAISKGPGSYTGLRIGTSTAKGLCYGLEAKLIAVDTLKAMAYSVSKGLTNEVFMCPMIDARRMEVYCSIFNNRLEDIEGTSATIIDSETFHEYFSKKKLLYFGDGAKKCVQVLGNHANTHYVPDVAPRAEDIGILAWEKYEQGDFEDLAYFEPYYLKDFIAKKPSAKKLV